MSLSPENAPQPSLEEAAPPNRRRTWQSNLLRICFVIFTFEIGLVLVVVPWMDESWSINSFQEMVPARQPVWLDPYFRGAITGLGLVNMYIAGRELTRLLRRT